MTLDRDTTFTWLGHSGIEIRTPRGQVVLVDPWFGNPKSPRTVDQQQGCDVLLITHGHFDHFDRDTLALAKRTQPTMPCIHELSLFVQHEIGDSTEIVGMNIGGAMESHGLRITMVPAVHSSGDPFGGDAVRSFGEPVGFVIELENGYRIYHAGDTAVFGDMRLIRELYAPDLAMLPIGGHFTMDPQAAAIAVDMLGVHDVLPIHWGTFPLLAGNPGQLRQALEARKVTATVHAWEPGDTIS